jgi:archaellum biogenesis ATPase FlaH
MARMIPRQHRGTVLSEAKAMNLRAIPEPILDFFRLVTGRSLVVKGESGTGKTTFALSLLEDLLREHYEYKHFTYVTSKMSSPFVSTHFKGYQVALLPDSVIDATRFTDKKIDETSIVVSDESSFFNLLNKYIGKTKYPVVVLDTLESLAGRISAEPLNLARSLNSMAQEKNAKIVLISDLNDLSPIDNIADGIVVLSMNEMADHIDRRIHIRKLRGVGVGQGGHSFTLSGNSFQKLWSVDNDMLRRIKSFKITPHSSTRFYSGLAGLDEILGGFRLGTTCFLEVGSNVGNEFVNNLVLTTAANFLLQKGGVFMIPPNKMSYRTVKNAALRFDYTDQLNSNLRLLTYQFADSAIMSDKPDAQEAYWKPLKVNTGEELEKEMDAAIGETKASGCNDTLIVLGFGLLKAWLGNSNLDRWAMRAATMTAEDSGLALLVGYESTADVNPVIADVADTHLSLTAKQDTILLKGIHPYTSYYSVYTYERDGGIHIGFQEVA